MRLANNIILLEAWLMVVNTFHFVFTIMFIWSILKIVLQKYSPYSQFYIATFAAIQAIWDGCPISSFINFFNIIGGYEYEQNSFFFGVGGEWTAHLRGLAFFMVGILYWGAFETWYKADAPLRLGNYFKRGDFKMSKIAA